MQPCGGDALSLRPLSVTRSEVGAGIVACLYAWIERCKLLSSAQSEKMSDVERRWRPQCQRQTGDICAGLTLSIKYYESHRTRDKPLPNTAAACKCNTISADE
jgi:hypothetical protein